MRRVADERGAVAVVVALVMVPLIAFAAVSLDLAGLYWEKQQLQTGADAGALAIAQACGAGSCGDKAATATSLARPNHPHAGVTATVLATDPGKVTVRTTATQRHLFAPLLGVDSTQVLAESSAVYGSPSAATAMLPLAFSWCEWQQQTTGGQPSGTTEVLIRMTKDTRSSCTGPSNNTVPGGFGWLTAVAGTCMTRTAINDRVMSDPGNSVPTSCTPADFTALRNRAVLLPLYDQSGGSGSNAWYRIYGYAAFTITAYGFTTQYSWNTGGSCPSNGGCLKGYFTSLVTSDEAAAYSATAPNLGASVVKLTP